MNVYTTVTLEAYFCYAHNIAILKMPLKSTQTYHSQLLLLLCYYKAIMQYSESGLHQAKSVFFLLDIHSC